MNSYFYFYLDSWTFTCNSNSMEITSRSVSAAKSSGTGATTSERRPSSDIITTQTTPPTTTCGRDTIWALCTTLVEQSSGTDCYLRDEALRGGKKVILSLTFFSSLWSFSSLLIIFGGRQQIKPLSPCQPCRVVGHLLVNLVNDLRLSPIWNQSPCHHCKRLPWNNGIRNRVTCDIPS